MGTRADFYVGRGENAEWIGSIAWDGYPDGITPKVGEWPEGASLFDATTEDDYRARVAKFFEGRDDVTRPADGWPWPWETSHTTDYAYAFDGGQVFASCFGNTWFDPRQEQPEGDESDNKPTVFPNFAKDRNPRIGSKRSGVMVIGF